MEAVIWCFNLDLSGLVVLGRANSKGGCSAVPYGKLLKILSPVSCKDRKYSRQLVFFGKESQESPSVTFMGGDSWHVTCRLAGSCFVTRVLA